jgi:hypothetical protein
MNRRNKEFAEEVRSLLLRILDIVNYSYDRDVNLHWVLEAHMRDRMIATKDTALRHFDNLNARDIFIVEANAKGTFIKLNPKKAGTEIDLLICTVHMPNLPSQTQVTSS